jgi:GntR family transcriptional regulator
MRFWITRNSELPIREQLVHQVVFGILSEELPAGYKLPSVRALARRHRIHANTVSAAWHELLERGWLELRRGSGLYVRGLDSQREGTDGLDGLLAELLRTARGLGHEPEEVLARLSHHVRPRTYERVVIAEPDPAMREILLAEISSHVRVSVEAPELSDLKLAMQPGLSLVVALTTRFAQMRRDLPRDVSCFSLHVRSVSSSLEGQAKPEPDAIISIASRSAEIRFWARAMLIAVGIPGESLCEVDSSQDGWEERLRLSAVVVTDIVTGRAVPAGCPVRVYQVIADSCMERLRAICS